jgi:predicted transcriptional regulator
MPTVASNLRITLDANRILTGLAERLSRPKAQVIELALRQFDDRLFWADVQKAFAEGESPEMAAERELWDTATPDGLAREHW